MSRVVKLPPPQLDLDFPLMTALRLRRTRRKWLPSDLSHQDISNILWSACGMTMAPGARSKSRRTSPSARNTQAISVYAATEGGVYSYDETCHEMSQILIDDIRPFLSNQRMMKSMPLGLIYVSDYSRLKGYAGKDDRRREFISGTEAGCISQNVYLYCASARLSTALIGLVDRERLHHRMGLEEHQKIVYTQAVGKSVN